MARLPRYAVPRQPQHVIQRGNNRSVLFAANADYRIFIDCLKTACEHHGCQVHAYVLMTNHLHLLMAPESEVGIGKVMQSVGRRYVQYFNFTYGRTGTLWEGRYKATLVDSERYLLTCCRYIELNPVRAGIVEHPSQYRWSSYSANALGQPDSLLTMHPLYLALGSDGAARCAAYRELFRNDIDDDTLCKIREATNKGWALGHERFHSDIAELLNRRARPLRKGGDRRSQAYRDRGE
jgi:putative transposase